MSLLNYNEMIVTEREFCAKKAATFEDIHLTCSNFRDFWRSIKLSLEDYSPLFF